MLNIEKNLAIILIFFYLRYFLDLKIDSLK